MEEIRIELYIRLKAKGDKAFVDDLETLCRKHAIGKPDTGFYFSFK